MRTGSFRIFVYYMQGKGKKVSIRDFFYRKAAGRKKANRIQNENQIQEERIGEEFYEYCPNCEANLTLQKGYSRQYPYWKCRGCGKMLINPDVKMESPVIWICDKCGAVLNQQEGFAEALGEWECRECGFRGKLDKSEIYISDEEYEADCRNPYKGMSQEALMALMVYKEKESINGRADIMLVEDRDTGEKYVEKILKTYDITVYDFLKRHPIKHMPRLYGVYEGANCLVVIEEYIAGQTLSERIGEGWREKERMEEAQVKESRREKERMEEAEAVRLIKSLCLILQELHSFNPPIIHRDVKPSNIILSEENEVFLLDVNAAKWYNPEKKEDTRLLGTMYYAAPEQLGYGFAASSVKTDIYAVGILLNVMLTGKFSKEEKASGSIWNIIEKCICYETEKRFTDTELIEALDTFLKEEDGLINGR